MSQHWNTLFFLFNICVCHLERAFLECFGFFVDSVHLEISVHLRTTFFETQSNRKRVYMLEQKSYF